MTLDTLLASIYNAILEPLLFVVFGLAFIMFVWGIVEFIRDSESNDGREKGKRNILWGVVGMVIMVSVFGIINIIIGTIGADLPQGADTTTGQFRGTLDQIDVSDGQ